RHDVDLPLLGGVSGLSPSPSDEVEVLKASRQRLADSAARQQQQTEDIGCLLVLVLVKRDRQPPEFVAGEIALMGMFGIALDPAGGIIRTELPADRAGE